MMLYYYLGKYYRENYVYDYVVNIIIRIINSILVCCVLSSIYMSGSRKSELLLLTLIRYNNNINK